MLEKEAERGKLLLAVGQAAALPVPAGGCFGQEGVSAPVMAGDVTYVIRFPTPGLQNWHSLSELLPYLGVKVLCGSWVLNYSIGNKSLS